MLTMGEKNKAEKSMNKWKLKYLSNLDQLKRQEQKLKEVESLMCHGIARLGLLATGADDELDGQPEGLGKSVRGKQKPSAIRLLLENRQAADSGNSKRSATRREGACPSRSSGSSCQGGQQC